jgi:hypothetical protein
MGGKAREGGVTDTEVLCSARSLIERHGAKAAMAAAIMADKLSTRKDKTAHDAWVRITLAIRELERADSAN